MKKEWINFGDIDFMEYGGCLVKETDYPDCFEVIWLVTSIPDYKGKYKNPMMVARLYVDVSSWMDGKDLFNINDFVGNPKDYIPQTTEEKMQYAVDLINYYGIAEFEPDFPSETGCSHYGFVNEKIIVGKQIAQRFLKEYGVPVEFRK